MVLVVRGSLVQRDVFRVRAVRPVRPGASVMKQASYTPFAYGLLLFFSLNALYSFC